MFLASASLHRALLVGVRLSLLLAAAGAVVVAVVLPPPPDRFTSAAAAGSEDHYTCPMHPEVRKGQAGSCPICQMALLREAPSPAAGGRPAARDTRDTWDTRDLGLVTRRLAGGPRDEVRAPAWVEGEGVASAIVPDDVLRAIGPETRAAFIGPGAANAAEAGVPAALLADAPAKWDLTASRARFRIARLPGPAGDGRSASLPRVGDVGTIVLVRPETEVLVVPSSAVIQAPEGPYVLAASADGGSLTRRPVTLGSAFSGLTVVLSGLREREIIVGRNTFFPDAGRRTQAAQALASRVREAPR